MQNEEVVDYCLGMLVHIQYVQVEFGRVLVGLMYW